MKEIKYKLSGLLGLQRPTCSQQRSPCPVPHIPSPSPIPETALQAGGLQHRQPVLTEPLPNKQGARIFLLFFPSIRWASRPHCWLHAVWRASVFYFFKMKLRARGNCLQSGVTGTEPRGVLSQILRTPRSQTRAHQGPRLPVRVWEVLGNLKICGHCDMQNTHRVPRGPPLWREQEQDRQLLQDESSRVH